MSNEQLQVDLLLRGDITALHVMDVFPKYPLSTPARYENPQAVWGAFADLRSGIFGPPTRNQMDTD